MVSVQDNVFSLWRGIVNSGSGYGRRKDDCEHIFEFESGKRFVTDIELKALATVFSVSLDELI